MTIETALQTNERIAELTDNLDSVITLPEVAARIVQTINDSKSTATDLHKIISHDPALVSRILKRVNSSFYGRPTKIDSVERAIVLMGFDAVNTLALSATLGQIFKPTNISEDFTARDLWTHCVAVAAAAREMAKRVNKQIAEEAFLAGLLHDIGLLVEMQVCPEKLRKVCDIAKKGETSFSMAEYDLIGCNHAEIGAALAAKWGFPDYCRAAVAYHHMPALAEPEHRQMVAIVYAADTLCAQDAIGFNLTANNQIADSVASEGMLPLSLIDYTRENLPQLVSDAIIVFGS
ncbi:MAG TPA: HDOD domain-containing protein [Tepidisphaeraceae bacterium]|jgi:putative nucleotidyltransferase with HDIG domain